MEEESTVPFKHQGFCMGLMGAGLEEMEKMVKE